MKNPRTRVALAVGGLLIAAALVVAAQATQDARTPPNELLAELRAFRADVQQAARISVRAQLLVARLRLQEQRINVLAAQLTEVRRLITIKESGQLPIANRLREVEERLRAPNTTYEQQTAMESELNELKARRAQFQKEEQQHRLEEAELASQVATEQGRWIEFNTRLDDLEAQLPAVRR
jgi:chromosome segregation ATPase